MEDKYIQEISLRRLRNISDEESKIFQRVIDNAASNEDIKKIPGILEKCGHSPFMEKYVKEKFYDIIQMTMEMWMMGRYPCSSHYAGNV